MISAPINRVETPHEVCQTYSLAPPASLANWISKARAKFWPSS